MSGPSPQLLQAQIGRLMRPLVALMIRSGLPFPAFMDLMRKVYVEVALSDFRLDGKEQTDSRVTLLTGVHRKEVRRLREEPPDDAAMPPELSQTSRIVARWMGAPDYSDDGGRPRPLPRSGPAPSFEALVASVTKDVRPRAVLDDWIDRGLAAIDAAGEVTLAVAAVLPKPGEDAQLYYFGRNLHDHAAAAASNVAGGRRFLERAVHYDGLTAAAAEDLEAAARQLAAGALETANARAQAAVGDAPPDGGWRWNFGVYVYLEPPATPQPPDPTGATK